MGYEGSVKASNMYLYVPLDLQHYCKMGCHNQLNDNHFGYFDRSVKVVECERGKFVKFGGNFTLIT